MLRRSSGSDSRSCCWIGLLGVWAEEKSGVVKLEAEAWGLGPAPVPRQLCSLEQGSYPPKPQSPRVLWGIRVLAPGTSGTLERVKIVIFVVKGLAWV